MIFKNIKRLLTSRDVRSRESQELEKGVEAVLAGDLKKYQKHMKRAAKLKKLVNK